MKPCSRCGVGDRHKGKSWCISCIREDNLNRYHTSRGNRREAHRLAARKSHIKKTYGITYDEYLEMFAKQGGKCAICDSEVLQHGEDRYKTGCIDHCHSTGKVRGILCWDCNVGLGKFKDSIESLRKAITYLEDNNV